MGRNKGSIRILTEALPHHRRGVGWRHLFRLYTLSIRELESVYMMIKRCGGFRFVVLLILLAIPSAAFAQDMSESHPPFYVYMITGDKTELVKINPQGQLRIEEGTDFAIAEELPLTIEEALPEVEVKAFEEDLKSGSLQDPEALQEPGIRKEVWGFWAVKADEFLVHRNYVRCNNTMIDPCYGYTEFSLLNTTTDTERVLWTLPYHEQREEYDSLPCYKAVFYENYSEMGVVGDVQLNPTRDLAAIVINGYGEGCKDFVVLLDYGTDTPQGQRFDDWTAASWSPDGDELAYLEENTCDRALVCVVEYAVMTLDTGQKKPFQQLLLSYPGMLVWLDADTVVYSRPLMPAEEMGYQEAVVWHKLRHHSEVVQPMSSDTTPDRVFRVSDGETAVVYSTTWVDGETQGVATILTDDPSDVQLGNYQVESANSRSTRYAVVTLCIGVKIWCERGETGFIDANGNISLMNLDHYREQYGADRIEFAALAVDE
jgi:hypothetical protein